MSDILSQISALIESYNRAPKNTPDVEGLLLLRRRLANLSFKLAELTGEAYHERNGAEYRRKRAQAVIAAREFASGKSAAAADQAAKFETDEEQKQEAQADGYYRQLHLLLGQVNEILSCMSQHIAFTRREHHAETTGQGSQ